MAELVQQHPLAFLQCLAFGNVESTFEHEASAVKNFKLQSCRDRQYPTILSLLLALATPTSVFQQLGLHLLNGAWLKRKQFVFTPAYRFGARIAIEFFAAAVPVAYCT